MKNEIQKILLVRYGEISGISQKSLHDLGILVVSVDDPSAARIADVDEFKGTPIEIEVSENSFGKTRPADTVEMVGEVENVGDR